MKAGKMKRRVTIQQFVSHRDPNTGSVTKEWRDVATVWGDRQRKRAGACSRPKLNSQR